MSNLIDAEKLDLVSYQGIPDGYKDSFDSGVLYAMNLIDEQPTIDAVPVVHGKWVDDGKFKYKHGGTGHEAKELFGTEWRMMERRKCSVCYKVSLVDDSIWYGYCPHCGALMDEVTE